MKGLYLRGTKYWYQFCANGQRHQLSTGESDEARAIEKARLLQEEFLRGDPAQSKGLTIHDATARVLEKLRLKGRSRRYIDQVAFVMDLFEREIGVRLSSDVTPHRLQQWLISKEKVVKAETAGAYFQIIKRVFNDITGLQRNPSDEVIVREFPSKRQPRRTAWINRDDMDRLITECFDLELRYCLYAGFHAGLRKEEVIMSRPQWFDLRAKVMHIQQDPLTNWTPKGRDLRSIPLTDQFIDFLEKQYRLKDRGTYMIAPDVEQGKARYRFDFKKRFVRYIRQHGFAGYTFHDLRRSFASQRVSDGKSVYMVAEWLGDDVAVVQAHYGRLATYLPDINLSARPDNVVPMRSASA